MKMVPIAWTTSSVGQICLQMEKLVFEKNELAGWLTSKAAFHPRTLSYECTFAALVINVDHSVFKKQVAQLCLFAINRKN